MSIDFLSGFVAGMFVLTGSYLLWQLIMRENKLQEVKNE